VPFYFTDHAPASEIYSSVHDLVRFGMFHIGTGQVKILKGKSLAEMRRPAVRISGASSYGIGWRVEEQNGAQLVWHTGGMEGVSTVLALVPSARVVVVALTNTRADFPVRITREILRTLLPREARSFRMGDPPANTKRSFRLKPRLVGRWRGRILTHEAATEAALAMMDSRMLEAQVRDAEWSAVYAPAFRDDKLTGMFQADMDGSGKRETLLFELLLSGDRLSGPVTVLSGASGRIGNALTHWMELKKEIGK
jgi:CubicO group peptidase (beta-lactamase class C family)